MVERFDLHVRHTRCNARALLPWLLNAWLQGSGSARSGAVGRAGPPWPSETTCWAPFSTLPSCSSLPSLLLVLLSCFSSAFLSPSMVLCRTRIGSSHESGGHVAANMGPCGLDLR